MAFWGPGAEGRVAITLLAELTLKVFAPVSSAVHIKGTHIEFCRDPRNRGDLACLNPDTSGSGDGGSHSNRRSSCSLGFP